MKDHAHTFDKEKQMESISDQTIAWTSDEQDEEHKEEVSRQLPRMDDLPSVDVEEIEEKKFEAEELEIPTGEVEETVIAEIDVQLAEMPLSPVDVENEPAGISIRLLKKK